MIGRLRHPDEPERTLAIPLASMIPGVWSRLDRDNVGFDDPADAQRTCIEALARTYAKIIQASRRVRAFCEHPDFVFDGEVIDAAMVREQVVSLDVMIRAQERNVPRLLDDVRRDDVVRFGRAEFRLGDDGLLVLQRPKRSQPRRLRTFERIDEQCFAVLYEALAIETVERQAAEDTIFAVCENAPLDVLARVAEARPDMLGEVAAVMAQLGRKAPDQGDAPADDLASDSGGQSDDDAMNGDGDDAGADTEEVVQ